MTSIESFLPQIQPHVSGCPESIILDAIRNACIRFCTDTWIIRENIPASDILTGDRDGNAVTFATPSIVSMPTH